MDEAVVPFDRSADGLDHPTFPFSKHAPTSGIWANNTSEVIYYTAGAERKSLDG